MRLLICLMVCALFSFVLNDLLFYAEGAAVSFRSEAKLELIQARSNALKGIINTEKRSFAFSVPMASFEGFNSPLQKQHFNENYLESNIYKTASFTGRIIEKPDLTQDGVYQVRAKGKMSIHGVTKERIIKSQITVKDGVFKVEANFSILLSEYNITIPKVVQQKIAEEIQILINANFEQK
jgi:polyisoprenoid-binding protein YceI